jgi:hypothetical protein
MPEHLAKMVRAVCRVDFGDENATRRIWELSAVAPNIRKGRLDDKTPPRFWYMLPDFARRHRPDVFMARVNAGTPKAYLNKDAACIIDANFATLWTDEKLDKYALFALLNSSWSAAFLEYSAAVMGGGALKVEATHLKRLYVPAMNEDRIAELVDLGKKLANAKTSQEAAKVLKSVDSMVASAALGRKASTEDIEALRTLVEAGKAKRQKHKSKGMP